MNRILIITYYWPPAGGPGVQRVLKFAKFLPENGWKPIILTVNKGEYPAIDESLQNEIRKDCVVIKTPSIEPFQIYKQFLGQDKELSIPVGVLIRRNLGWKAKITNFIRLNMFIPDARIGWFPHALKTGKKIIQKYRPNIILSSSPPATAHLIAQALSKKSNVPWVADFRDPWTNIYYYDNLPQMNFIKKIDQYLERKVLHKAAAVTVVSSKFFNKNSYNSKITLLPNGYDKSDLKFKAVNYYTNKFTIIYMGSLKITQYVDVFFDILRELSSNKYYHDKISVEFIGYMDPSVRERIMKKQISCDIVYHGYLPHDKALNLVSEADLLLHIIGTSPQEKHIFGGKLFEYLMVRKPILSFGPKGEAADRILRETKCGKMFDYSDKNGALKFIKYNFELWKSGTMIFNPVINKIEKYDRRNLTKELVKIFEGLI